MRAEGPKERTSAVYPNINRAPARTKLRRQFAVRLSKMSIFGSFRAQPGGAVCFDNSTYICGNCTLLRAFGPHALLTLHVHV